MKKGLIHIYTGNGKGKTTAAVGLATRVLGHHKKVCYVFFHKRPEKYGYAEIENLKKLGAEVHAIAKGHPFLDKNLDIQKHRALTKQQFEEITHYIHQSGFDLLVLDEAIVSARDGFLPEDMLMQFITNKPDKLELVLTGRGASEKLITLADYVSEIKKVKHPYDKNIKAREGIEY